jgi:hypothetical protein
MTLSSGFHPPILLRDTVNSTHWQPVCSGCPRPEGQQKYITCSDCIGTGLKAPVTLLSLLCGTVKGTVLWPTLKGYWSRCASGYC